MPFDAVHSDFNPCSARLKTVQAGRPHRVSSVHASEHCCRLGELHSVHQRTFGVVKDTDTAKSDKEALHVLEAACMVFDALMTWAGIGDFHEIGFSQV